MKELGKETTVIKLRFYKDVAMIEVSGFRPISFNLFAAAVKAAANNKDLQTLLKSGIPKGIDTNKT